VDAHGRLVGNVSRFDILAAVASAARTSETLPAPTAVLPQTAGDIMFRHVPTVAADASLNEVLNKIVATPLRRVVVVDALGKVAGIIVDADLLARVSPGAAANTLRSLIDRLAHRPVAALNVSGTAADVMVRDVYTVREDTPLVDVIGQMLDKHVKRMVVLDEEGRLAGMVDRQSVLESIAGHAG
jgi:CBS domain-containing protein